MATENQATVSWNANTEPDLAGYRVFGGQAPGIWSFTQSPGLLTSSLIIADPDNNGFPYNNDGIWYFSVAAFDTSNNLSVLATPVSKRIIRIPARLKVRR